MKKEPMNDGIINPFQSVLHLNSDIKLAKQKLAEFIQNTPCCDLINPFCDLSEKQQKHIFSILSESEHTVAFLKELDDTILQRLLEGETKERIAILLHPHLRKLHPHEQTDILVCEAGRPCSLALTTPIKEPIPHLKTSRFLGVSALMLPHELWPMSGSEPMTCILNICIAELPFVPDILEESAWLVLYTDVNGGYFDEDGWVIREYPTKEGLIERKAPAIQEKADGWTPLHITWRAYQDMLHPRSDVSDVLGVWWKSAWKSLRIRDSHPAPKTSSAEYGYDGHLFPCQRNAPRTKIGGFPTYKQFETKNGPSHPAHFLLQIFHDHSVGYDLCDCAITYVGIDDNCNWIVETLTS